MAIEKLSVILELVSGNYQREARNAANATGQIGNSAKSVTGQLGAMIGPAAIGGAILGLGKMALAAGENADRLFDLQAQTGLSTDALQEWEFVAKAAGATTEVFSDAVKVVIRNLSEAAGGTGAAAKAYEKLGISVLDASGNMRDAGAITDEVFEKLAGMENITARNALAQDIFGKKWEETISILDLGTEALGNLREEGKKGVVSAEALRNSDKFRETWQKFIATVGPKLNEVLGRIAPALTEIAEGAVETLEALEPLLTAFGWVADRYADMKGELDDLEESDNRFLQFLGTAGNMVVGFGGGVGSLATGIGTLTDAEEANVEVSNEVHDSWTLLAAAEVALRTSLGPTITMLDNQYASHRNVARAADTQRIALINLANAQADMLDPLRNVLMLQKENAEAQKRLTEAQASGKTSASELAIAIIEAEQAELRLNAAGAALSSEQISEFANLLITDFGMSQIAALDLLDTLGLLDGWEGRGRFVLTMDTVVSGGGGGRGNVNSLFDEFGFDSGGIVPGPRGSQQLILAHGGETILPTHKGGMVGRVYSPTFIAQSPMQDMRSDMQYLTILASVTNLVENG